MLAPLENGGARAIFKFILLQNAHAPFTKKLQFFWSVSGGAVFMI
jgi:hypothetical protein